MFFIRLPMVQCKLVPRLTLLVKILVLAKLIALLTAMVVVIVKQLDVCASKDGLVTFATCKFLPLLLVRMRLPIKMPRYVVW